MTGNRSIKPVKDNYDKQQTYKQLIARYNLAMKDGFYLEAIFIDYAMIEDRLRSFIYHIGGFTDRGAISINEQAKKYLKEMVQAFDPKGNLGVSTITGKIRIVRSVFFWEENGTGVPDVPYLKALKNQLESVDVDGLLKNLDNIDEWRAYRNECIHSLMNKNMESLGEEIATKAEEGMQYARFLDSQVRIVKKGNCIRRTLKLGNM